VLIFRIESWVRLLAAEGTLEQLDGITGVRRVVKVRGEEGIISRRDFKELKACSGSQLKLNRAR